MPSLVTMPSADTPAPSLNPQSLGDIFRLATSPDKERLVAEQLAVMSEIQDLAGEIQRTFRRAERAHREGKAEQMRRAVEKWVAMIEAERSLEARQNDLASAQLRETWRIVREALAVGEGLRACTSRRGPST